MELTILDLSIPRISRPRDLTHRTLDVSTRLRNEWAKQGIKLRPGMSRDALAAFESRLNVRFPDDLKEYFLLANGFDGEMDDECITFFTMEDALKETSVWTASDIKATSLFAFADFL